MMVEEGKNFCDDDVELLFCIPISQKSLSVEMD